MTSLESAFFAPLTLKLRWVEGYGCSAENRPVEVRLLLGWITCRMLLSSNGPPLRTTTTCPPSALVNPVRKAKPGTTTTNRTTTAAIKVVRSLVDRLRGSRSGRGRCTDTGTPGGWDDGAADSRCGTRPFRRIRRRTHRVGLERRLHAPRHTAVHGE